jgi:hypothetical protein
MLNSRQEMFCKQGGPFSDSFLLAGKGYFPKPTFEKFRKDCPGKPPSIAGKSMHRNCTFASTAMLRDRWAYRY